MKHIAVNLKRFDVPKSLGGISLLENHNDYVNYIIAPLVEEISKYKDSKFYFYLPEAYLLEANKLIKDSSNIVLGCQSNHYDDIGDNGNFGAFTSEKPAAAMKGLGACSSLIGHFEERKSLKFIFSKAGSTNINAENEILNMKIKKALQREMTVCYCIGEDDTQTNVWDQVLNKQLEEGLKGVDLSKVIIGYEPIWSIGPGKQPAGEEHIQKVIGLVKKFDSSLDVIYGGGVKQDNAKMLAQMTDLSGGLVGLTNFKENIGFHPSEFLEIMEIYHNNIEGANYEN